jgi:Ser/Thr protein kinase RdoA (MazF antagonist)
LSLPREELEAVFGAAEAVDVEPLGHATPAATAGVWRVQTADDAAILKVVRHDPDGNERWPSAEDEADPYYWRREPLVYSSGLLDRLGGGVRAPRCRLCRERDDGTVALWLDDAGAHPAWTVERFRRIAADLGRLQGRAAAAPPVEPWLSRGWFRAYLDLRARWIEDYRAGPYAEDVAALWARRETILARVDAAPQTFCHFDFYPANVFGEDETVVIDWAYCGLGALGSDPGNLVPDAIFDGFVSLENATAVRDAVWDGYLAGLAEAGLPVDADELRYVFLAATALKFSWIPGTARARGSDDEIGRRWLEIFPLVAAWAEESLELERQLPPLPSPG